MIAINCDVGEGVNNEQELMPYITSCSIACGGHAGDAATMQKIAVLAKKHNVTIGAHPSYPDRANFGRVSMQMNDSDFQNTIQTQIDALITILEKEEISLHHIKAHGALYNDIASDAFLAKNYLKAIEKYKSKIALYVPYKSCIASEAIQQNFKVIYEAFADRNYTSELRLVSRKKATAMRTNIDAILEQILCIKNEQKVYAITGEKIDIKATTFCVHSDTKNAIEIVKHIYNTFNP